MANISVPTAKQTPKPPNSFPAWRVRKGTINATEAQLESASSSCERWEWGCAALVVVAVVVELALASIHPSYDSPWNRWGTAFSDAAIALGIIGEVLFGRLDARVQTELRKRSNDRVAQVEFDNGYLQESAAMAAERASVADQKASEAQLELARLTTRRGLSEEQMTSMSAQLAPFAEQPVTIAASPRMHESEWLADQLAKVLRNAGADAKRTDSWATVTLNAERGVVANFGSESERGRRFAVAVCDALNERDILSEPAEGLMWNRQSPGDWVLIVVGEKP